MRQGEQMKRKEIEALKRNLKRFTNEALESLREESINHICDRELKAQNQTMEWHLLRIGIIDTILVGRGTEWILQETT